MAELYELKEAQEQVILVAASVSDEVSVEDSLDELEELVKTAGAVTVGRFVQNRQMIDTATYIGSGKVLELRELILETGATGIVCDE